MSDIAVAARRLNVHPSTCWCRLARAQEIFGLALAKAGEHLLLWLQPRLSDQPRHIHAIGGSTLTGPTLITRLDVRARGAQAT